MKCFDETNIQDFISGKLEDHKMLDAILHVQTCETCKKLMSQHLTFKNAAGILQQQVLNCECPDYTELSAYAEGSLPPDQFESVRAHLNACEFCAKDIDTIRAQRSRAALVPRVVYTLGENRRNISWKQWFPRLAPVAGALAAAAVVALVFLGSPHKGPGSVSAPIVAERPSTSVSESIPEIKDKPVPMPTVTNQPVSPSELEKIASAKPDKNKQQNVPAPKAAKNTRIAAKPTVDLDLSRLHASAGQLQRIKQAINEKLNTGVLTSDVPVRMAMADAVGGVRSLKGVAGPQPVSPSSETVLYGDLTLKWRPVEGAEEYRIELTDAEGKMLASANTEETHFVVDSSEISSEGGILLWRVAVRLGSIDIWESSKASVVRMLSAKDSDLVRNASIGYKDDHLVLGTIYEYYGLYPQAEAEYRKLLDSPNRPKNAPKMLSSVLDKM